MFSNQLNGIQKVHCMWSSTHATRFKFKVNWFEHPHTIKDQLRKKKRYAISLNVNHESQIHETNRQMKNKIPWFIEKNIPTILWNCKESLPHTRCPLLIKSLSSLEVAHIEVPILNFHMDLPILKLHMEEIISKYGVYIECMLSTRIRRLDACSSWPFIVQCLFTC